VVVMIVCCFFFQAEDGIRDFHVTGVQTCALPIFDHHLGGGVRRGGRQVLDQGAGVGAQGGPRQRRGRQGRRVARLDVPQVVVPGVLDLVVEQVQRAGGRQQDEKGQHQQAGVEMPAPYRAVDVGAARAVLGGSVRGGCRHVVQNR